MPSRTRSGVRALAQRQRVPCVEIGRVGGDRLTIRGGSRTLVDLPVTRLHEAWMSLERLLIG